MAKVIIETTDLAEAQAMLNALNGGVEAVDVPDEAQPRKPEPDQTSRNEPLDKDLAEARKRSRERHAAKGEVTNQDIKQAAKDNAKDNAKAEEEAEAKVKEDAEAKAKEEAEERRKAKVKPSRDACAKAIIALQKAKGRAAALAVLEQFRPEGCEDKEVKLPAVDPENYAALEEAAKAAAEE